MVSPRTELREAEGGSEKLASKAEKPKTLLPELVYELSLLMEGALAQGPSEARVRLRMVRYRLAVAFPRVFRVSQVDLAQQLAELDGDEVDDGDVTP